MTAYVKRRRPRAADHEHGFKPGDLIHRRFDGEEKHRPISTVYMYIKSTEKSHYLLRLFTIDVSKYYGGNVHYICHTRGVKARWRDGLREPVLTLGCLAGKKRSNRKDQTISQRDKDAIVELMSTVLEDPDDLSIVKGSISYIEKLKGFQRLKGVDDFMAGFIAQLELNRAYFQEKPLDDKQLSQLRSCFQHHIPYLIAAPASNITSPTSSPQDVPSSRAPTPCSPLSSTPSEPT